ncbi:unnamed protein product [Malus baccata var. baccata]
MVNTKIIRQPSQPPLLSSLLPCLSLHHPRSSLFFLSPHHITLKSPTLTLSFCSLSLTLAPPPRLSLSEPDTHRILFLLSPPQFPIRHSLPASLFLYFSILSAVSAWVVILCGGFQLFSLRLLWAVPQLGSICEGFLASLEYLVGVLFFLSHVLISSAIRRTEL